MKSKPASEDITKTVHHKKINCCSDLIRYVITLVRRKSSIGIKKEINKLLVTNKEAISRHDGELQATIRSTEASEGELTWDSFDQSIPSANPSKIDNCAQPEPSPKPDSTTFHTRDVHTSKDHAPKFYYRKRRIKISITEQYKSEPNLIGIKRSLSQLVCPVANKISKKAVLEDKPVEKIATVECAGKRKYNSLERRNEEASKVLERDGPIYSTNSLSNKIKSRSLKNKQLESAWANVEADMVRSFSKDKFTKCDSNVGHDYNKQEVVKSSKKNSSYIINKVLSTFNFKKELAKKNMILDQYIYDEEGLFLNEHASSATSPLHLNKQQKTSNLIVKETPLQSSVKAPSVLCQILSKKRLNTITPEEGVSYQHPNSQCCDEYLYDSLSSSSSCLTNDNHEDISDETLQRMNDDIFDEANLKITKKESDVSTVPHDDNKSVSLKSTLSNDSVCKNPICFYKIAFIKEETQPIKNKTKINFCKTLKYNSFKKCQDFKSCVNEVNQWSLNKDNKAIKKDLSRDINDEEHQDDYRLAALCDKSMNIIKHHQLHCLQELLPQNDDLNLYNKKEGTASKIHEKINQTVQTQLLFRPHVDLLQHSQVKKYLIANSVQKEKELDKILVQCSPGNCPLTGIQKDDKPVFVSPRMPYQLSKGRYGSCINAKALKTPPRTLRLKKINAEKEKTSLTKLKTCSDKDSNAFCRQSLKRTGLQDNKPHTTNTHRICRCLFDKKMFSKSCPNIFCGDVSISLDIDSNGINKTHILKNFGNIFKRQQNKTIDFIKCEKDNQNLLTDTSQRDTILVKSEQIKEENITIIQQPDHCSISIEDSHYDPRDLEFQSPFKKFKSAVEKTAHTQNTEINTSFDSGVACLDFGNNSTEIEEIQSFNDEIKPCDNFDSIEEIDKAVLHSWNSVFRDKSTKELNIIRELIAMGVKIDNFPAAVLPVYDREYFPVKHEQTMIKHNEKINSVKEKLCNYECIDANKPSLHKFAQVNPIKVNRKASYVLEPIVSKLNPLNVKDIRTSVDINNSGSSQSSMSGLKPTKKFVQTSVAETKVITPVGMISDTDVSDHLNATIAQPIVHQKPYKIFHKAADINKFATLGALKPSGKKLTFNSTEPDKAVSFKPAPREFLLPYAPAKAENSHEYTQTSEHSSTELTEAQFDDLENLNTDLFKENKIASTEADQNDADTEEDFDYSVPVKLTQAGRTKRISFNVEPSKEKRSSRSQFKARTTVLPQSFTPPRQPQTNKKAAAIANQTTSGRSQFLSQRSKPLSNKEKLYRSLINGPNQDK